MLAVASPARGSARLEIHAAWRVNRFHPPIQLAPALGPPDGQRSSTGETDASLSLLSLAYVPSHGQSRRHTRASGLRH